MRTTKREISSFEQSEHSEIMLLDKPIPDCHKSYHHYLT